MENIMDIIIRIVATLLALGAGYLGKLLVGWIKSKLSAEDAAKLDLFIDELCKAAEQMYKTDDPDGTIRLRYVESMLTQAGYEITDAVRAMIESKVFAINLASKGGEVK